MSHSDTTTTLELPRSIVDRVERRVEATEFDSPEAYVTYVLEDVLYRVEEGSAAPNDGFDRADEAEMRGRLEALGYLDE
ncbi:hypothetical protein [Halomarina litorea]|uniref:hypothetical protein n=1 Tax=Halomarina litorea TaxID=2961595 RepID=UPI0020C47B45|nr:hypothetical protein [Halomarina sp. BCD28]